MLCIKRLEMESAAASSVFNQSLSFLHFSAAGASSFCHSPLPPLIPLRRVRRSDCKKGKKEEAADYEFPEDSSCGLVYLYYDGIPKGAKFLYFNNAIFEKDASHMCRNGAIRDGRHSAIY